MKVLIADKFEQRGIGQLRELGADVTVDPDLKDDALRDALAQTTCKVLIVRSTRVTEAMFAGAPELAMVIRADGLVMRFHCTSARVHGPPRVWDPCTHSAAYGMATS